jgi:protein TonB
MRPVWVRGMAFVAGSLGLHVAALVSLPALFPGTPATPLFVDLSTLSGAAAPPAGEGSAGAAGGRAGTVGSPRRAGWTASRAARPATTEAPTTAAALPAPAPLPTPAVTPVPGQEPAPPPPVATAPAEAPRQPEGGAPAASGDGERPATAGARDGGAGMRSDAPGEGGSAPAGGGDAPLALARPGTGPRASGGVPPEYAPYLARFRQRVEAALVYPLAARRQGRGGRVELDVRLEPSGRVTRVDIVTSSASAALDEAAVEAVKAVEAVPFPAALPRRPLLVRIPLVFELR